MKYSFVSSVKRTSQFFKSSIGVPAGDVAGMPIVGAWEPQEANNWAAEMAGLVRQEQHLRQAVPGFRNFQRELPARAGLAQAVIMDDIGEVE